MSEYDEYAMESASPPARPGRWPLWPWLVIVAVSALLIWRVSAAKQNGAEADERVELLLYRMQARYLLGASEALPEGRAALYDQAKIFARGPVEQRLRFIVVAGEMAGADEALAQLDQLAKDLKEFRKPLTPEQARVRDLLDKLYGDYRRLRFDAPSLIPEDRAFLCDRLGWFGELALAPRVVTVDRDAWAIAAGTAIATALGPEPAADLADAARRQEVLEPAARTFMTYLGGFLGLVCIGAAGLGGLVVVLILAIGGKLRGGLELDGDRGRIYAETFAVWLVLFFGLGFVARSVLGLPADLRLQAAVGVLTLSALVWPVLRGIPWAQVRRDIGWTAGRNPIAEPAWGVACYALTLPLIAVGIVLTLVLIILQRGLGGDAGGDPFAGPDLPNHPIVEPIVMGDWGTRLQVLLLASLVAPLVEETMFRGVLYRHWREASASWGRVLSVVGSTLAVSLIFAAIHPQGLVAIPALMMIACGLTLAREWRGSLVACVVAHALNNGLLVLLVMLAMGD